MNSLHRKTVLVSLAIGMAVAGAACSRSPSTASSSMNPSSPSTSSQGENTPPPSQSAMAPTTPAPSTTAPMAKATDDAKITAQVKSAISAEPGLKSTDIKVDTQDAVVTLSGTVPSAPLKDRAKEIASGIAGVKSVQDNLVTKNG